MVFELHSIESVSFYRRTQYRCSRCGEKYIPYVQRRMSFAFHSASENLPTREFTERSDRGNV